MPNENPQLAEQEQLIKNSNQQVDLKLVQKKQHEPSQEEIYTKLNKALSSIFSVIWIIVWPIGVIYIIILGWLGYNTHIRIGQIDNIKQDILDKKEDVSKIVTQVQISRIELSEKQNEIKNEQEKLSQEIKKQMVEIAKLGRNTHDTINRGNTLIERVDKARLQAQALKIQAEKLMANSEDLLTKNQKTIDQQIKFVEASKNSIATAITGVKKKNDELTKEVRTNADKEFARNKEIISQFIEYQLLIQNGRGIFPDPNKAAELKILDKIAEILYPNIQDRNEFVNKLNKI
jgi:hypothetical protein